MVCDLVRELVGHLRDYRQRYKEINKYFIKLEIFIRSQFGKEGKVYFEQK